MDKNSIFNKLRKLINLRDNAAAIGNEGEAQAAASRITYILMEYNMLEKDIPEEEKLDNPIIEVTIPYKSEYCSGSWYSCLIATVSHYNMCKSLISSIKVNNRMHRDAFILIGRKNNLEIVQYLISFLSNKFYYIAVKNYKNSDLAITRAKYLKSFLSGCISGLILKYKELEKSTDLHALIISSSTEIEDSLNKYSIQKGKDSKESIDYSIFRNGIEAGKNIQINKGVKSSIKKLVK
jgi:hypothetical protein